MIKLNVSAANIAVEEKETLTEGRVGLLCRFSFTGEWDGLAKTAVFDGADSRDVILTEDTVAVPAECLAAEGYSLSVGVYGKNAAGDIVIPTVYATVGKIQRSAYPAGKEAAPPTPDVVAQIQQAAANAEAMARAVREDAELGKFNGEQGEPGGWYTPEIRQPIKKSMVVNLIPSKEGMPAAEPKLILLPEGEAGGWYTPAITQPDANTMRVSFTPSNEDMPEVPSKDIVIPSGNSSGESGYSPVISVMAFGAVGDGVTDDTAAIQLAFDSTAAQGGNLYIPEGDYKITGQLTIADPICVSGDGCLKLYDPDSSADFAALTVDNGVRISGLTLEAQEGFAGVILKYYPTSNSIYPSRTRFKSLILQSLSTQKILSYFDVYGGNNYGLIIEDLTIGKPNTARYCQYGMRILTEGGYAGAGASWENSGTVRNLRIDTRGDHQLYAVGASGGVVPKNWVFENIAIQANSKLQGGNAFTYQDSFYLYRFAEVTLRNCKVWDASAAAYADGRAPVVYEDIIATTYIDGCAPAFYLDSGAVVLSRATTPEITAYRQQYVYDQLKEIAEKFDISSLTVSKTETDAETTLTFSDGTNTKSIAVSKLQPSDDQINAAISDWMDKNALPVEVWSKNVLNINDENVSMGYIASAGQINSSDSYWVSGYVPAKHGDVLRSSLNGAAVNFYYVAEYDEGKNFLYRNVESINTYTVSNESTAYIRVSWKTSLVSYKNEKAMLTLNNTDLSFEAYGSHMEGGLDMVVGPAGPAGADGKSAYAYAVEGGYTGTEAEFAAKLAKEKFANPNALTFTGAVTGSYDGSAPLSVEIPSGGGGDVDLSLYQEKQDNSLNPSDKTIVGAINEIDTISRKDFVLLVNNTLIADNAGLSSYEYELPVPVPVNRGIGILIQSPSSASAGYREIYNQNNKKIGKILNGSYTVRISLCEVKNGYYAVATHSSTNPAALVSNLSPGAVFLTPNFWDETAYYDKADDSITKVKLNSCDAIMQEGTKIRIWMY